MRAYKIEAQPGADIRHVVAFSGSMADAKVVRRTLSAQPGAEFWTVYIVEIDIPAGKNDLIEFLNNLVK